MGANFETSGGVEQTSDPSGKVLDSVRETTSESGGAKAMGGALMANGGKVAKVVASTGGSGSDDGDGDSDSSSGKNILIQEIIEDINNSSLN